MKTYYIDLSDKGIDKFDKILSNLEGILSSNLLKKYIADKCIKELKNIQYKSLTTINSEDDIDMSNYMNSNHLEVHEDYIYIYNDATIDVKELKGVYDKDWRANYPLKLSLASMIEFGIGYTGGASSISSEVPSDWHYDVNNHGALGWYYQDSSGNYHWTKGYEGRYIFLKLKLKVEEKIEEWLAEYIDTYMKD